VRAAGLGLEALAGKQAKHVPSVSSVLVADTTLQKDRVRFLAIVPDPNNRFPCARQGQVGLQEGWNLAKQVRDVIKADENGGKRAIIAIVDVPSQAYGRREELLGIFLAACGGNECLRLCPISRASGDFLCWSVMLFSGGFFDARRTSERGYSLSTIRAW